MLPRLLGDSHHCVPVQLISGDLKLSTDQKILQPVIPSHRKGQHKLRVTCSAFIASKTEEGKRSSGNWSSAVTLVPSVTVR